MGRASMCVTANLCGCGLSLREQSRGHSGWLDGNQLAFGGVLRAVVVDTP